MSAAVGKRSLRAAWRLAEATLLPPLLARLKAAPLSPRDDPAMLADLLATLRRDPEFEALGRALLDPDAGASAAAFGTLWPAMARRLPARGQHHLALLDTRWGWEALEAGRTADAWACWARGWRRWGLTLAEPDFLSTLASDCAAGAVGEEAAQMMPGWLLEPHLLTLSEALEDLRGFEAAALTPHWRTLTEAPALVGAAAPEVGAAMEQEAAAARAALLARVEGIFTDMARPVESTAATVPQLREPFVTLELLTGVFGMQEELSIHALETAVAWAWPLYKTREEARLQDLLRASAPFARHVERMLERGSERAFGRNSLVADYLLFEADFVPADEQAAWFERALRLCPGHRNSRLMLSYNLLNQARVEMNKLEAAPAAGLLPVGEASAASRLERADALLRRAEETFPPNEKIPTYRERLAGLAERFKVTLKDPPPAPPAQDPPAE